MTFGMALKAYMWADRIACLAQRRNAFDNIGSGSRRAPGNLEIAYHPLVVANIDLEPEDVPNFVQADVEKPLPFEDRQFGCVFASHVVEHLVNPDNALDEFTRIGDWVVVVLPHPLSLLGKLAHGHRHFFSLDDMKDMIHRHRRLTIYT